MTNIAQYITVYSANMSKNQESTPDCYPERKSLCNNLTCVTPSGERFNYSFLVCQDPIAVNIVHQVGDRVVRDDVFTQSQSILLGQTNTQLTFNHLDEDIVQFQVQEGS